jgi:hypothetical protein
MPSATSRGSSGSALSFDKSSAPVGAACDTGGFAVYGLLFSTLSVFSTLVDGCFEIAGLLSAAY